MKGQLALFDLPEREAPPMPPEPPPPPPSVRFVNYKPYRSKAGLHCDDCVREVHAKGWLQSPRIRQARWRRVYKGDVLLLCPQHKEARTTTESHQ
jgi:hypothetical protein